MRRFLIIALSLLLATAAAADTFNPNPITYRMNNLTVLDAAGNVPPSTGSSNVNIRQPSNGSNTIVFQRSTDSSPTGNDLAGINNAVTQTLWTIDVNANEVLGLTGTKAGSLTLNGGSGTTNPATETIDMSGSALANPADIFFAFGGGTQSWGVFDNWNGIQVGGSDDVVVPSFHGITLFGNRQTTRPALTTGANGDPAVTVKTLTASIDLLDLVNSASTTVTKHDSSGNIITNGYITAGGTNPTGGPNTGDLVAARSATQGALWLGSGGTTNGGFFQFNAGTYSFQNPAGGTTEFKIDGSGNATSNGFIDAGSYLTTGTEGQHNGATINSQQSANGNDTLWLARNTDSSPTGFLMRGVNAAQSSAVYSLDVSGNQVSIGNDEVGGNLKVDTGVSKDAGGIKHIRVFQSSWASGFSDFGLTWTTAFADNNYTVTCTMVETTASGHNLQLFQISNKSASGFTVTVQNLNASPQSGTVGCIALHD